MKNTKTTRLPASVADFLRSRGIDGKMHVVDADHHIFSGAYGASETDDGYIIKVATRTTKTEVNVYLSYGKTKAVAANDAVKVAA